VSLFDPLSLGIGLNNRSHIVTVASTAGFNGKIFGEMTEKTRNFFIN